MHFVSENKSQECGTVNLRPTRTSPSSVRPRLGAKVSIVPKSPVQNFAPGKVRVRSPEQPGYFEGGDSCRANPEDERRRDVESPSERVGCIPDQTGLRAAEQKFGDLDAQDVDRR